MLAENKEITGASRHPQLSINLLQIVQARCTTTDVDESVLVLGASAISMAFPGQPFRPGFGCEVSIDQGLKEFRLARFNISLPGPLLNCSQFNA